MQIFIFFVDCKRPAILLCLYVVTGAKKLGDQLISLQRALLSWSHSFSKAHHIVIPPLVMRIPLYQFGLGNDSRFSPQHYLKPKASNNSHFIISHNSLGVPCSTESCGWTLNLYGIFIEQKHWRWSPNFLVPPQDWVHRGWMAESLLFPYTLRTSPSHANIKTSYTVTRFPKAQRKRLLAKMLVSDYHPIGPSLLPYCFGNSESQVSSGSGWLGAAQEWWCWEACSMKAICED